MKSLKSLKHTSLPIFQSINKSSPNMFIVHKSLPIIAHKILPNISLKNDKKSSLSRILERVLTLSNFCKCGRDCENSACSLQEQ